MLSRVLMMTHAADGDVLSATTMEIDLVDEVVDVAEVGN
jgi:hypothetical protein